jgi:hypothetical protein
MTAHTIDDFRDTDDGYWISYVLADIVGKGWQTLNMVKMCMSQANMTNAKLLLRRQDCTHCSGIDENGLIDQEAAASAGAGILNPLLRAMAS